MPPQKDRLMREQTRKPKPLVVYGLLLRGAELTVGDETYAMSEEGALCVKRQRFTSDGTEVVTFPPTPEQLARAETIWLEVDLSLRAFYALCEQFSDDELWVQSAQVVLNR
jgi:hypothetical protein